MSHEMSLNLWLNGPARQIGWMLVHSVWQGVAAALLLAVVLRLMDRRSSAARYMACCAALAAIPAASIVVFSLPRNSNLQLDVAAPSSVISPSIVATTMAPAATTLHRFNLQASLGYAASVWMLGVALLAVWHLCGWLNLLRWRRECRAVEGVWRDALDSMMKRMHLNGPIRLLASARLATPAVVGIFRPMILVPIALAAELTPTQAAAILAHELSHIRRHDYLVNLIQTAIETLLFYHPAVWWISSQIRRERENCCDDLAAAMSDPIEYSRALLVAEGLRSVPLAMGLGAGSLRARIGRLIEPQSAPQRRPARSAVVATLIFVLLACVAIPMRRSYGQPAVIAPSSAKQASIEVVVTADGILVDHKPSNWVAVRSQLSAIDPAMRAKMRLNLSAESAGIAYGRYWDAQATASQIVHDLGLAFLSNTGIAAGAGISVHANEMSIIGPPSADGSSVRTEVRPVRRGDNVEIEVTQTNLQPVEIQRIVGNQLAAELKATTAPADEKMVGEYYIGGHVSRVGVYSLTGRKITLKEAITAAGDIDGNPADAHLDLIRRTKAGEVILRGISVADLFDGKIADVFLMPYDQIMVSATANSIPATYP